jgi:3-oxoacyl-[acyl-carrier-protein] synthase II
MIFPNTVMNSMAAVAAIEIGARGPSVTVNQATVAGDLAVARAAALVRDGRALAGVAGGVDEMLAHVYRRLSEMGMLSPAAGRGTEGCRPYEPDHNGVVLGEGATFVVLEDLDSARARGAVIHAEIRSAAWGNVPVAPHTAPRRRRDLHSPALRALVSAGGTPSGVGTCYGSGNGDPALDDWELGLLAADRLPAPRSLASRFGQHGGLGALRVAAAALDGLDKVAPSATTLVMVHGLARGGCRTALLIDRAA